MDNRWYHTPLWNEIGLPIGLLVMLLCALYVANGSSCELPHYDNTPTQSAP